MKIQEQINIAWVAPEAKQTADKRIPEFVIVHSREVTTKDANQAWSKIQDGDCVQGMVPIVFLDPELDSEEFRQFLDSRWLEKATDNERS